MNKNGIGKDINMKRLWMITCLVFCISVIIRFIFAGFNKTLVVYNDELRYLHLSRSLLEQGKLLIRNMETDYQKILYSIFIMPAFLFDKLETQLKCIAFLNCIYTSSAVFPVLLLASQILKKNRQIIFAVILTVIMPTMTMSMTFMSENIYYPICLWVCWLILHVLKEKNLSGKVVKCALLGVLSYLLYLNKEIGLAFLIVYFIMEIYYLLQEWRVEKLSFVSNPRLCGIFSVVLVFAICFVAMKLSLFRGMGNSYNQMGLDAVASAERLLFLGYSFLYNTMFAVIAFMVLPLIFPAIRWKHMDQEEKQFYIFSVLSLIIIVFVISYTISIREDFGKSGIRQHTRYYEPLFMLFMIQFMGSVFGQGGGKIKYGELLLPIGMTVLMLAVVKSIGLGSPVDSCMLKYYQYIQDVFPFRIVKILQGVIGVSTVIFMIARKKYPRSIGVLALGAVCVVCIMNNALAVKMFWREYRVSGQQLEEWEELNAYLQEENSGVLLILGQCYDDEARCADTFMRADVNYIIQEDAGELQTDISAYKDLRYIMTYAHRGIKNAEERMRCGPYTLYEVESAQHIELTECPSFPILKDQTRIITAEEGRFWTQSQVNDREYSYVSGKEEGFLICGPYAAVHPGVYDVTVYYEYKGNDVKGNHVKGNHVIGRLDMKYSGEEPDRYAELTADSGKAELKGIRVEESFDQAEVRVFTTVPGVIFLKAEITKVAE